FVAFDSDSSDLVPGDTNGARDVFVHDRTTGITTRVDVASDGSEGHAPLLQGCLGSSLNGPPGDAHCQGSAFPSISADGRYVAFESQYNNLVPGDTNGLEDTFVHD